MTPWASAAGRDYPNARRPDKTGSGVLGAFLYNMAAALLGGIEVTLAEDEK